MADGVAPDKVAFELVAPERLLASEMVDMVVAPGAEGDFGVLPQHSLFMSLLRPGVIEIYEGGQVTQRIFVGGGFAEVNERGCIVLAEEAHAGRGHRPRPGAPAAQERAGRSRARRPTTSTAPAWSARSRSPRRRSRSPAAASPPGCFVGSLPPRKGRVPLPGHLA